MTGRRALRIALWIFIPIGVLVALAGGLFYVFTAKFNPTAPSVDYPKPASALEAQRQDIDYFSKLIALDWSYAPAARAQAQRRLSALAAQTEVLDRGHLRVALQRIGALADNGHTSLYSKKPSRPTLLPIRFSDFSDGLYVMRVKKENADLLGARILKVDGRPVEDVLTALEDLRGGTKAFRRSYALIALNSPEYLHGLDIAASPDRSTWTFQTRSGVTVERTFTAYQPIYDEPRPDLWRWLSPAPIKDDKDQWTAYAPQGLKLPVTFQDADRTFRSVRLAGACTTLMQLKSNEDENGESISAFLKATEADLSAKKPCSIIFDDRFNGGGDYTNTASFASRLPFLVKPGGHIFVLTGVDTFSAGITTVVFIKQAAKAGQVTILGEPVGDRMRFYAEGNGGCLPNAPFCFHYATGMHDYAHRCTDWDKCFWLNWIYAARTDTLAPNETITMSFSDYLAGHDPVFDRALALAAKSAKPQVY